MLAEAGWKPDQDGWLRKNGRPLAFTILTNQGNSSRLQTAIIIQDRLKRLGIQVKIRAVEWAALLKDFIDTHDFEALVMGWTTPADPDPYAVWHSSKTEKGGLNFVGFRDAEVDELIVKARETFNQAERREYYRRFQAILRREQPYTFLYVPEALPAVASRIHGVEPSLAGLGHNFTQWFVPKELQKYHYAP